MATRDKDSAAPPHLAVPQQLAVAGEAAVGAAPAELHIPGRAREERIRIAVAYAVLAAITLLYFVPFLWSIVTSLKTLPESAQGFDLLPDSPSLRAYREVFSKYDFLTFFKNSAILAGAVTLFNLFLGSLGGYAFARLRFPGREVLFLLVLGTLMIPDQLRLVPVYLLLIDFPALGEIPVAEKLCGADPELGCNLTGTFQGYIAINLVMAVNLFLMRQYFLTIPKDYEEAAKLDAAGYFKTYLRVMLPLATPALAAVAILTFQGIWNDFFWALIVIGFGEPSNYTVQLGLTAFRFEYQTLWPQLMAATTIATLPVVVIYIFFQRYFIAGVAAAGVKG